MKGMKLEGASGSKPIAAQGTIQLISTDNAHSSQCLHVVLCLKLILFYPQQWSKQGPNAANTELQRVGVDTMELESSQYGTVNACKDTMELSEVFEDV